MIPVLLTVLSQAQANDRPLLLDFGPEHGTVLAGFSEVTPWNVRDTRAAWITPPVSVRDGGWPDPLLRDGVTDGVLHLKLPPGTWTISALFDDVDYGYRPTIGQETGLTIDGAPHLRDTPPSGAAFFASRWYQPGSEPRFTPESTTFDRHVAPATPWRSVTLNVGEDGLRVSPYGGAVLTALIARKVELAEAEVELALVDAARRAWMIDHRPDMAVPDLPRAKDGPILLESLAWDRTPSPEARQGDPAPRAVAPGQRISWVFGVHGGDMPATVWLDGLEGWDAEVHEVRWHDTQEHFVTQVRPWIVRPLVDHRLVAGQGLTPMFAIIARAPADVRPGPVPVAVRVRRGDQEVRVDLPLRVRALHLEPVASELGMWADLRAHAAKVYGPDDARTQAIWARDVALLRSHEVDRLNLRGTWFPGNDPSPDHEPRLAWALEAWRKAGGGRATWVDTFRVPDEANADPARPVLSDEQAATMKRWLEAAKRQDVDLYVDDEHIVMRGPGRIEHIRRYLDAIQALNEGIGAKVSIAETQATSWEMLRTRADVNYLLAQPWIHPNLLAWWDGARVKPLLYNLGWKREHASVVPWTMEAEAVVQWHYNEPTGNPFNPMKKMQWQLAVLAPDGASVWSTVPFERLTEGVQDQRYLTTASALAQELAGRRSAAARDHVQALCAVLRASRDATWDRRPTLVRDIAMLDEQALQDLQAEIGDRAERAARLSRRQKAWGRGERPAPLDGFYPDEICGPRPESLVAPP